MPWKECSVMDERLQFVAELCREFGISRKTGYKIFDRYQECGVQGLTDRSRRSATMGWNCRLHLARRHTEHRLLGRNNWQIEAAGESGRTIDSLRGLLIIFRFG
jgi:leucine-zipper of insertion element IS481